ncbi:hypothetical protein M3P05_10580 [Sansalvadorimonas sp. 2012CJ34-2]|uniref:Uncharacterized protein n=1 Tax=Parendozoicomonas callyspongiae TaxID=2942213 RepID=A0ABT0PG61_9GAMM|nr:hypothetical protein [Sansalvadorimonas sp. 2012CJ34-2]MCL6270365.1 hypothetical protein [Sansalvadorimonas sp. 2012CJ34-2]
MISGVPKQSRLWQVTNPDARDFRMTTLEPAGLEHQALPLFPKCSAKGDDQGQCEFNIKVNNPSVGWTAWFAEFVFSNNPYPDFVVTTPVKVTPDTYPEKKS